jgi:hypothetical protein
VLRSILLLSCALPLMISVLPITRSHAQTLSSSDVMPDTWAATDALGRKLPDYAQVGPPRKDKFVGIFYFLWLGQHAQDAPYDITKILKADPNAMQEPNSPLWGPPGHFHYWGEPLFGYYYSDDPWVLRKHAEMLADAGVDVIIFDVTNQFIYQNVYTALCKEFTAIRAEGGRTPQIAFLCPFWNPHNVVEQLYDKLYKPQLYKSLWFMWKGKPLILADPAKVPKDTLTFFTFRKPQPDYFKGPTGPDQWGWLEIYPQHIFYDKENRSEEMTVGVAQNARDHRLCAISEPGARGRNWHDGAEDTSPHAVDYGYNFAEQWRRALKVDPEFIFVTGWNEWIAQRLNEFNGVKEPVMFVDEFDEEYSRDCEPMKGGHGDDYYYQLVNYIRRFKGVRPTPLAGPMRTIRLNRSFAQWDAVSPAYGDWVGDTMHRDHPSYRSIGRYVNTSGRNDFVLLKVARDRKNFYFYAKTRQAITPPEGAEWMNLYIRVPGSKGPNWEGYQFVVNKVVKSNQITTLSKCMGGWKWSVISRLRYRIRGNEMMLSIPRQDIGLSWKPHGKLKLEFKWADNCPKNGDVLDFWVDGDTAPDGRFRYVYDAKE